MFQFLPAIIKGIGSIVGGGSLGGGLGLVAKLASKTALNLLASKTVGNFLKPLVGDQLAPVLGGVVGENYIDNIWNNPGKGLLDVPKGIKDIAEKDPGGVIGKMTKGDLGNQPWNDLNPGIGTAGAWDKLFEGDRGRTIEHIKNLSSSGVTNFGKNLQIANTAANKGQGLGSNMLSRATNPSSFLKGLQIKPEDFIAMQLEANAKVDKHNEEERLRSWHSRRVMPGRTYQGPLFDSYTGYTGQ